MRSTKFQGTGVAMVTPFTENGKIDFDALERVIKHITSNGVEFLVAMGTTSEAVTLSKEERTEVVAFIKSKKPANIPLVMGLGGNDTKEVLHKIEHTDFNHVDGILSVAPYYNKPGQEGIFMHFSEIAKVSPVPIILYNVPGRTSINIDAQTTIRLAETHENIVAVKEASGDFALINDLMANKPDDFTVLSGDDPTTVPMIAIGAKGVITVTGNAYPKEFSDMVRFALNSDFVNARKLHTKLNDVFIYEFIEGNPAGVKTFLEMQGICKNHVRLPLTPVSQEVYKTIEKIAKTI